MAEWKKIAGGIGAAALVLAGSYFGLDAGGDSGDSNGAGSPDTPDSTATTTSTSGDTCAVDTLPEEADEVIDRILTDQDHLYATHDGKHFGNYEGRLPRQSGDYYREYTVVTPGDSSRGARRIVVGGGTENDPDVWYYTDDHYESFCSIPDAED
ncbi:MAG: ribonuclease domain-containing protein [Corynebacterium sp.]|uniref:ribonuclease domain-containing protein n=1 Tax=Corynebacterium sp. TaxID=1720 RepID=UPI0026DA6F04|nr:ribonuclease domain-containing protein [Corynebacterium sp.]MDO5029754.1 ribonuclease domain-containing protein [Corynebacterium sp.]